jgi:hypothetical protein
MRGPSDIEAVVQVDSDQVDAGEERGPVVVDVRPAAGAVDEDERCGTLFDPANLSVRVAPWE